MARAVHYFTGSARCLGLPKKIPNVETSGSVYYESMKFLKCRPSFTLNIPFHLFPRFRKEFRNIQSTIVVIPLECPKETTNDNWIENKYDDKTLYQEF